MTSGVTKLIVLMDPQVNRDCRPSAQSGSWTSDHVSGPRTDEVEDIDPHGKCDMYHKFRSPGRCFDKSVLLLMVCGCVWSGKRRN